jgi:hypothetical protein
MPGRSKMQPRLRERTSLLHGRRPPHKMVERSQRSKIARLSNMRDSFHFAFNRNMKCVICFLDALFFSCIVSSAGRIVPRLIAQLGCGEKTEYAQSAIHRDHDQPLASQAFAVKERLRTGTKDKAPAMEPDENRPFLGGGGRSRPDIQEQAILANRRIRRQNPRCRTGAAELVGLAHSLPREGRLRRTPATLRTQARG